MNKLKKYESPSLVKCSRLEVNKRKISLIKAVEIRLLNKLFKSKELNYNG